MQSNLENHMEVECCSRKRMAFLVILHLNFLERHCMTFSFAGSLVLVMGSSDLQLQLLVYLVTVDHFIDPDSPEVSIIKSSCIQFYLPWFPGLHRNVALSDHLLYSIIKCTFCFHFCPILFHCTTVSYVWSTLSLSVMSFNFNKKGPHYRTYYNNHILLFCYHWNCSPKSHYMVD